MAKHSIDDILNDLGIADENAPARRKGRKSELEQITHSPIPAAPGNQRNFLTPPPAPPPAAAPGAPAAPSEPSTPSGSSVGLAIADLYRPEDDAATAAAPGGGGASASKDLGERLVEMGVLGADKLAQARNIIKQSPGRTLLEIVLEQGADEVGVQRVVAELAGLPFERIDLEKGLDGGFSGMLLQRLTPEFAKRNLVMPLRMEGHRPVLGVTKPDDVFMIDEAKQRMGAPGVKLVVVTSFDIRSALEVIGENATEEVVDVSEILAEVQEGDVQVNRAKQEEVDLEKEASDSPVIKYVNHIIQLAVKEGASDIHIEPADKKLKVRFRIDGELYEMLNPPAAMGAAITSRLKIMANLDISERRLPQDGRIRCQVQGRKLDLRMSTLPNTYGEKTVMRILDTKSINVELENLGFDEATFQIWKKQVDAPHGIVLVTGPTGSGKTTTLYASLRQIDKSSMNVCTVEDPVEYHLEGITQTQMHEKIGMTFATALRALLRQDPDVIMLGEIRDTETAQIAVQAALTGHLVLSTLHTNDAPSSITRLVNIGLEPFLVGAAVNAVLAQRLIRKLCVHCKSQEAPTEEMAEYLSMQGFPTDKMWVSKGCERCRKLGYSGRVGIYELLTIDDQLRDMIARNPNVAEFRRICMERGMVTLRADGMSKAQKGVTTVQEVFRVTEAVH